MKDETRNLYLAIGLSLLVIIGWQFFYGGPKLTTARQTQEQVANAPSPGAPPNAVTNASPAARPENPGLPPGPGQLRATLTRDAALAASQRVELDTPNLSGSINLKGGRLDDIALKGYRETVEPNSPNIVLLSPEGSPEPYYAQTGFLAGANQTVAVPKDDTVWTASAGSKLSPTTPVTLTWDNGQGQVFRRTFAVDTDYMFTTTDTVDNKGTAPITLHPFSMVSRVGTPKVSGYAVLFEGMLGVIGDSSVQEISYASIEKETQQTKILKGDGGWIGFTDKYWATTVIPDQSAPVEASFREAGAGSQAYQTSMLGNPQDVPAGGSLTVTNHVFAGAKVTSIIDSYKDSLGIKKFDLMIDWGWFYFITKPMFWLLDHIVRLVGNFGIAILCLTVVVKAVFFPLANKSYMSMAKMKALQPKMAAMKERYPDDKAKQQQETMALYKREKINPVAGCLPMLIQVPVFFALYKVIFITIEMRQAPFFGWIRDLSAPDPTNIFNLFGLLPYDPTHLPVIGHFLAIGIWPLVMGFSMFLQMKMNPAPPDPTQQMLFNYMPVIFTFMLGTFPAGLVIYWTWNNTLSVLQQYLIMRRAGVKVELWDNLSGVFRRKAVT